MMTLMAVGHILLLALFGTPNVVTETGKAGVFGTAGDKLAGGPLACSGRMLDSHDLVCAHRTLPCGTALLVQNARTKRVAPCLVLDRGPYGALLKNGRFVIKKKRRQEGTWRAVVDLSPQVATLLGITGVEMVRLFYMPSGPRYMNGRRRSCADPASPPPPPGLPSSSEPARRPPQPRLASL